VLSWFGVARIALGVGADRRRITIFTRPEATANSSCKLSELLHQLANTDRLEGFRNGVAVIPGVDQEGARRLDVFIGCMKTACHRLRADLKGSGKPDADR